LVAIQGEVDRFLVLGLPYIRPSARRAARAYLPWAPCF